MQNWLRLNADIPVPEIGKGGRVEEREGALVANFQSDEGHSHTAPISYKQERGNNKYL